MAIIHQATLQPTKLDLLADWLPTRSWCPGPRVDKLGSYRFDDPAGEVGLECFLLDCGAGIVQVPLSYRAEPMPDGDGFLIGTLEHSVLGTRYVYDAIADPVWINALATAMITGGREAEEQVAQDDGTVVVRASTMQVRGTGDGTADLAAPASSTPHTSGGLTVITDATVQLIMARTVGVPIEGTLLLTGRWPESAEVVLAGISAIGSP